MITANEDEPSEDPQQTDQDTVRSADPQVAMQLIENESTSEPDLDDAYDRICWSVTLIVMGIRYFQGCVDSNHVYCLECGFEIKKRFSNRTTTFVSKSAKRASH